MNRLVDAIVGARATAPQLTPESRRNPSCRLPQVIADAAAWYGAAMVARSRRHLLRLWLVPADARQLPVVFAQRYGNVLAGERGAVTAA